MLWIDAGNKANGRMPPPIYIIKIATNKTIIFAEKIFLHSEQIIEIINEMINMPGITVIIPSGLSFLNINPSIILHGIYVMNKAIFVQIILLINI